MSAEPNWPDISARVADLERRADAAANRERAREEWGGPA